MPTEKALQLMRVRKTEVCECCGINPAEEAHHCLYRRNRSNKKAGRLLDMDLNLQLVCKACHEGKAKGWENKIGFWQVQCVRYGRNIMLWWHDSIPYKVKERGYK